MNCHNEECRKREKELERLREEQRRKDEELRRKDEELKRKAEAQKLQDAKTSAAISALEKQLLRQARESKASWGRLLNEFK